MHLRPLLCAAGLAALLSAPLVLALGSDEAPEVATPEAQPALSVGAQPAAPAGAQPALSVGARPALSVGAQPAAPAGARPALSVGAQPAAPEPFAPPARGIEHRRLTPEEVELRLEELRAELEVRPGSAEDYELRREVEETAWAPLSGAVSGPE